MKHVNIKTTTIIVAAIITSVFGCTRQDHCSAERVPKNIGGDNGYISFADLAYMSEHRKLVNGDTVSFFAQVSCISCVHPLAEYTLEEFQFLDYGEDSQFGDSIYMIDFSSEGTYYNSNGQRSTYGGEHMTCCYVAKNAYTDSIIANRITDSVYVTAILGAGSCVNHRFPIWQTFIYDNSKIIFKDERLQTK